MREVVDTVNYLIKKALISLNEGERMKASYK